MHPYDCFSTGSAYVACVMHVHVVYVVKDVVLFWDTQSINRRSM